MSTCYLSLQVVDILGIVDFGHGLPGAWHSFFAEPGGAAQSSVPARAPGFRAALRGQRDGLDLESDSPAGAPAELDVRLPVLFAHRSPARSSQLPAVPVRRHAAVDALQRDRAALGAEPAGSGKPDHQDRVSR